MVDTSKMTDEELYAYLTNEEDQSQDEEAGIAYLKTYFGDD